MGAEEVYLTRKEVFAAAHHYRMPRFSEEETLRFFGNASTHGHNYVLEITIRGPVSEKTGMVENLKTLKEVVRREALADLDQHFLNEEVDRFREEPPTLENISGYIQEKLQPFYPGKRLHRVKLAEMDSLYVEREHGRSEVLLTRVYHFCASHRLHEPGLSGEENREIFGKCNNPSGHGHNYEVEVTVSGEVNPRTGTVGNIVDIDRLAEERVIEYLDHTHLNADVPEFGELNPTAENIAKVIWDRLDSNPGGAKLYRIRLYETPRNIAEYYGPGQREGGF